MYDNFGKNYFGINVFMNSLPLADFSCFSLRIAVLLSGNSSEYITTQGLNREVYPLFIGLLCINNLLPKSEVNPIYIFLYPGEYNP